MRRRIGTLMLSAVVTTAMLAGGAQAEARTYKHYSTCVALNKVYPHGVGKPGAHDHTKSGRNKVTNFHKSTGLYNANKDHDGDGDGIACEKR